MIETQRLLRNISMFDSVDSSSQLSFNKLALITSFTDIKQVLLLNRTELVPGHNY